MKKRMNWFAPTSNGVRQRAARIVSVVALASLLVAACAQAPAPTPPPPAPTVAPATAAPAPAAPTVAPAPAAPTVAPTVAPTAVPTPKPAIKVGVTAPLTGPLAPIGQEVVNGIKLFAEQNNNRLAGREIKLIIEDTESEEAGLTKVRKLVELDRVDTLIVSFDGTAAAARDYLHNAKKPALMFSIMPDLTQERWSPYFVRFILTTDQLSRPLAYYSYAKQNVRSVSVVTSDYGPLRSLSDGFVKTFTAMGGKVAQEVLPPMGSADFLPFLAKIGGVKTDAVLATTTGPDAIRFTQQYAEFGLKGKLPLIGLATVDDALLPAQGDSAVGTVTSYHYATALNTPGNKEFVESFTKKYNHPPDSLGANGWVASQLLEGALKAVNGDIEDTERFLNALRTLKLVTVKGPMTIDKQNNPTLDIYIAKIEKVGGKVQATIVDTIKDVDQYWTAPKQ